MNKRNWIWITLLALLILAIISIPLVFYIEKFYPSGFSAKNQDWSNFGSYLGGIYSSGFGLVSTIILCLTLYFTIKNNKEQTILVKNESLISLLISHTQVLNEKLDKRKNIIHYLSTYNKTPSLVSEGKYIEDLQKRYNLTFTIHKQNNPSGAVSPFDVAFDVLTDLRIRYPQEITSILNIIVMIKNCGNSEFRQELIRLFHSLTYRDRTYWLVMYAYHVNSEAKQTLLENPSLIAVADGLSI